MIPQEIMDLFEGYALELIDAGWTRYSSDAILHRIRWHMHVEEGNREFKCNDHWTSVLSRWFMAMYPQHEGFFETREHRK